MHLQPIYVGAAYCGAGIEEYLFNTGPRLPSGRDMTGEQQDEVIYRILDLL